MYCLEEHGFGTTLLQTMGILLKASSMILYLAVFYPLIDTTKNNNHNDTDSNFDSGDDGIAPCFDNLSHYEVCSTMVACTAVACGVDCGGYDDSIALLGHITFVPLALTIVQAISLTILFCLIGIWYDYHCNVKMLK